MREKQFDRQTFTTEFLRRLFKSGFSKHNLVLCQKSGPFWTEMIASVIRSAPTRLLRTRVTYSLTVEEAVARGRYDFTYGEINSYNFSHKPKGYALIRQRLFCFGEILVTPEVLVRIRSAGYRPSTLHELLAIGEQHPDEQRKYPIVGLGSVWLTEKGFHGVGCIDGYVRRRRLDPAWLEGWWRPEHRFAAVKL